MMTHKLFMGTLAAFCMLSMTCLSYADQGTNKEADSKTPSPRIASKVDVEPVTKLSAEESREVSFAAGRILKHVAQARAAIADKKHEDASKHIRQGLKLVKIIDNVLPHYTVTTEIKSADHVYHEEEDATPRYVTLFEELDRVDLITPIARAKKEATKKDAKEEAQKNSDDKQAKTVPASTAPVVSYADLQYTSLRFDLQLAKQMLNLANTKLAEESHDEHLKADDALLALQAGGVILEYDELDLPLEQAADNLKLAEEEVRLGRHDAAKAALNAAADELKKYEESAGENRQKEVKQLHDEITTLTATLEKGKPSDSDAQKHAATISGLWHRVTGWFKGR